MPRRTRADPRAGAGAISRADREARREGRLEAADSLRALATVLVVVIHTSHWPAGARLYDDIDLLSRLAVPAFMILTGVLLGYQYGGQTLRPGQFLRRRFSRSLLPWLCWAPVYATTGWLITTDVGHSWGGLGTFFSYGAGHLWFLLLIPQMYLLFLVWPRRHLWLWAGLALAVQFGLAVYRLYGHMPAPIVEQLTLWHGFQLLPFWVGYFAIGLAAGRSLARRGAPTGLPWAAPVAAALATMLSGWLLFAVTFDGAPHQAFQGGTGGFLLPQEPLFVISVSVLVLLIAPWLQARAPVARLTQLLSDNSLGVYILHPILVFPIASLIYGALLAHGAPFSLVGFTVLTIAALVVATMISVLVSATALAPILGARRQPLRLTPPPSPRQPQVAGRPSG